MQSNPASGQINAIGCRVASFLAMAESIRASFAAGEGRSAYFVALPSARFNPSGN